MNDRIFNTFKALTAIDSPSRGERNLCDELKQRLTLLGAELYEDRAGEQVGGDCGNLYAFIKGAGEPVLLSAHMDTVEPSRGKRAILHEDGSITSAGDTVLGADDIAGVTIILEAITRIKEQGIPHRSVELLFPVAEEIYCGGSKYAEYDRITAKQAYILDLNGEIGEAAYAAPTILSFDIQITGRAAHAGFAPADGINAIAAAASAISEIKQGTRSDKATLNIGKISGGIQGNIVPDLCEITGEIRSLSHENALSLWSETQKIFVHHAKAIGAEIKTDHRCTITAYETPMESRTVLDFQKACNAVNIKSSIHSTMGGSDNNNFALHGIEGLVIANAMRNIHSTSESTSIHDMETCVELIMEILKINHWKE
ncbi:M20/M25/M40 family metallo-hydrolase [Anoxybacterium hadale]|uniref:M20/M25/M40 family metallo-hydrolase n=1 Tax=Anoxybacterium hadale TaxID=3408580 RepID=A0ACD1AHP8_9FIRM|nr:M20/M25/M40 family metallo-hydrolase [Clostridiales bacterium]